MVKTLPDVLRVACVSDNLEQPSVLDDSDLTKHSDRSGVLRGPILSFHVVDELLAMLP